MKKTKFMMAAAAAAVLWLVVLVQIFVTRLYVSDADFTHAFAPGQHKGQYECLVQVEPVTVFRDKNADNVLDYMHPEKGMFGIHIHRANAVVKSKLVDRWSAGCTVIADPADFSELMFMVRDARKEGQERFTYTLLEEADLV